MPMATKNWKWLHDLNSGPDATNPTMATPQILQWPPEIYDLKTHLFLWQSFLRLSILQSGHLKIKTKGKAACID